MPAPWNLRKYCFSRTEVPNTLPQAHARRGMSDHVGAMRRYRNAVADLL
jgi:hypothetical protein